MNAVLPGPSSATPTRPYFHTPTPISMHAYRKLQSDLLRWYRAHRRPLPWRDINDPFATWVSEIMLQQTQAQTVIPYFERFMARFPTVQDLADASMDEVLKQWQGLGYYARARNLHAGARKVVLEFGGNIPSDVRELLKLPGIGRYTAGAIASIAFNQPEPILDGNVARVLCRIFEVEGDPKKNPTRAKLWSLARELVNAAASVHDGVGRASDFNQALIELGALVCTPSQPDCLSCPVAKLCEANRLGLQSVLPETASGPATVRLDHVAAIIRKNGRYLIARLPLDGVWGGLWEFPRTELHDGESLQQAVARVAKEKVNLEVEADRALTTVTHSFTHHRITLHACLCRFMNGRMKSRSYDRCRWVKVEELDNYAFAAAQARLVERLQEK